MLVYELTTHGSRWQTWLLLYVWFSGNSYVLPSFRVPFSVIWLPSFRSCRSTHQTGRRSLTASNFKSQHCTLVKQ